MSVLIKGMEMPKNCYDCPFAMLRYETLFVKGKSIRRDYGCIFTHKTITSTKRNRFCPLIPVPSHGRLIDADTLKVKQQEDADLFIGTYTLVEKSRRDEALNAVANIVNAPTVIEAEEGE